MDSSNLLNCPSFDEKENEHEKPSRIHYHRRRSSTVSILTALTEFMPPSYGGRRNSLGSKSERSPSARRSPQSSRGSPGGKRQSKPKPLSFAGPKDFISGLPKPRNFNFIGIPGKDFISGLPKTLSVSRLMRGPPPTPVSPLTHRRDSMDGMDRDSREGMTDSGSRRSPATSLDPEYEMRLIDDEAHEIDNEPYEIDDEAYEDELVDSFEHSHFNDPFCSPSSSSSGEVDPHRFTLGSIINSPTSLRRPMNSPTLRRRRSEMKMIQILGIEAAGVIQGVSVIAEQDQGS
ncbi:hypothetical protein C8J56DRAFT_356056 [Mycena floridula]|nr:hypothetical protein C8J56DRAFT_356056 [Mycena floridula]